MFKILSVCLLFMVGVVVAACDGGAPAGPTLRIVSGSENETLQPMIDAWADDNDVNVEMVYLGSVDISLALAEGSVAAYDAVWPANSLWIELGDDRRLVKHAKSIQRTPIVFGLHKPIAADLGWVDNPDVTIQDILAAAEAGRFRFAMTSATQSNSGASAYIGMLYAMAGNPDVLQAEHVGDPAVQADVKRLLRRVDRSSGSSGWLKDSLIAHPDRFDAMFNYEAMVIEANRRLTAAGEDPLCAIYPSNGLMVADSPLGYIDQNDPEKERIFLELQAYLLSPDVQKQIEAMGRRAGLIGLAIEQPDPDVWNPDWCIDVERAIAPVPTPSQEVIRAALDLYQTSLRKPSLTVWVLDVSGSMKGEPIAALQEAMTTLLDPGIARRNLLQSGPDDVTIIIPFNSSVTDVWALRGNDPEDLRELLAEAQSLEAAGGTDLYAALITALNRLKPYAERGELEGYLPAIVAMTDGKSDVENRQSFLDAFTQAAFADQVPIHTIAFGDADEAQLRELSEATIGRLFHSGDDLPKTLRKAKGYN